MADGINLSFISSIAERVAEKLAINYDMMDRINEIKSTVKKLINTDETFRNLRYYRTTEKIDDSAVDSIDFLIRKSQFTVPDKTYSNYSVCDKSSCKELLMLSIHDVEEETKQAMEAVIHNLNSMHCLPGSEEIWVKDATDNKVKLITMKNLHNTFSVGRYKAFSINMKTGITELKDITASANQGNNRDLVTLISDSGQRIRVTTNHKVITINEENGTLIKKYPEDTEYLVSPKKISINDDVDYININDYASAKIYKNSSHITHNIKINKEFAYFLGIYVADGSIINERVLTLSTCEKYNVNILIDLVCHIFGDTFTYKVLMMPDDIRVREVRINLGTLGCRFLKSICGSNSVNKKVPSFIFTSNKNICCAFLNGYFLTDGRRNTKYNEVCTHSKELSSGITFLIHSLGELPNINISETRNSGYTASVPLRYTLTLGNKASRRIKLHVTGKTKFEINRYSLSYVKNIIGRSDYIKPRESGAVRYSELDDIILYETHPELEQLRHMFTVPVHNKEYSNSLFEDVYDISVADNENFMTRDCVFVSNSRAGRHVAV